MIEQMNMEKNVDEKIYDIFWNIVLYFDPKKPFNKCWATRLNIKQEHLFDKNKETKKTHDVSLKILGQKRMKKFMKEQDVIRGVTKDHKANGKWRRKELRNETKPKQI